MSGVVLGDRGGVPGPGRTNLADGFATLERFAQLGRRVYAYEFSRVSPGARTSGLRAFHTGEIPYLFGWPERDPTYDDTDARVAEAMRTAWVAFAGTGIPRDVDGAHWARFDDPGRRVQRVAENTASGPLVIDPVARTLNALRTR